MNTFRSIDEVHPSLQFVNSGPEGWSFTLWGAPTCDERVHRQLIESVASMLPNSTLTLPGWQDCEDCIEGRLDWEGLSAWIWFETVLNFTSFWSADRAAIIALRTISLSLAGAI